MSTATVLRDGKFLAATSAVIVCEASPYWTPELQRQFDRSGIAVRGCRKWAELADRSTEFRHVVQIVNFDDLPGECLTGLRSRSARQPYPLILLVSSQSAALEFVLREAGVSSVFTAWPTGRELAQCCRRWLNHQGS